MKTLSCLLYLTLAGLLGSCQSFQEVGVIHSQALVDAYPEFAPAGTVPESERMALQQALEQALTGTDKPHLVVYFGTWCHDSARELPHLLALLNGFSPQQLSYELYGLDSHKRDPAGRALAHRVFRTPTLIVEIDNQEAGRITEHPSRSWGEDLALILTAASAPQQATAPL